MKKIQKPEFHGTLVAIKKSLAVCALSAFAGAVALPLEGAESATGAYCVIDVARGPKAEKYPVVYLDSVPEGGWTDVYKISKIALKRIERGTFLMQNEGKVDIRKPYYIGVYEITQHQYELVTGVRPSHFRNAPAALRPVEQVSYEAVRGGVKGAEWPGSAAVDPDSFIGRLRARTGLTEIDLPTEAQWEYACRAGTSTPYYWGEKMDPSFAASYENDKFTRVVGTTKPNAWGLYDMCGNVWEWCRDWYGETLAYGTCPVGPVAGTYRVLRGGAWRTDRFFCTSFKRTFEFPWNYDVDIGFRIVCTAE